MSICKPTGDKNLGRLKRIVHIEGKNDQGEIVYLTNNLKWSEGLFSRGLITYERACHVMGEIFYQGSYDGIQGVIVDE